jgi:hypothetical protein
MLCSDVGYKHFRGSCWPRTAKKLCNLQNGRMHVYTLHIYCFNHYIKVYSQDITMINISIEQSPWDVNSHSASPEIPCLLWNPKVHYFFHKIPLLGPILSQMNPMCIFLFCFSKIHSIIHLHLVLPMSCPFRSFNQTFVCISHHYVCCVLLLSP